MMVIFDGRFAIVFSDGYWNFLVKLLQPEQNGEVNYQSFLSIFAKGNRHEDRCADDSSPSQFVDTRLLAKQILLNMAETRLSQSVAFPSQGRSKWCRR